MRRVIDRGPSDGVIGHFNLLISFDIFPCVAPCSSRIFQHPFQYNTPYKHLPEAEASASAGNVKHIVGRPVEA